MTAFYIHIPFCRQACHYCDFHFSTSLKYMDNMVLALQQEIVLRKNEIKESVISSIYFGGGSPSLLATKDIGFLLRSIYKHYTIGHLPEITLEANPEDVSEQKLIEWKSLGINRLSVGVQSFYDQDLKFMNRVHHATQAKKALQLALSYFNNITIDLIYGIPNLSNERWLCNLEQAVAYNLPHISCYALTVEKNTALQHFIEKGKIPPLDDNLAKNHYDLLLKTMKKEGYQNYEFSNFGKEGYFSINNTTYWSGNNYTGIGPSAHSFNGTYRSWNVSHNHTYIKAILKDKILPLEKEYLNTSDRYNEYILTSLRTQKGIDITRIIHNYGEEYKDYFLKEAKIYLEQKLLIQKGNNFFISRAGKFIGNKISSDLFYIT